ncbi:MAG: hypothetical protein QXZ53_04210 [Candidatus Bathyarchaeia archaeon]
MRRELGDFVEDIINAMSKALKFVENMSYEEFAQDKKLFLNA